MKLLSRRLESVVRRSLQLSSGTGAVSVSSYQIPDHPSQSADLNDEHDFVPSSSSSVEYGSDLNDDSAEEMDPRSWIPASDPDDYAISERQQRSSWQPDYRNPPSAVSMEDSYDDDQIPSSYYGSEDDYDNHGMDSSEGPGFTDSWHNLDTSLESSGSGNLDIDGSEEINSATMQSIVDTDGMAEPAKLLDKRGVYEYDSSHVESFRDHWIHYVLITGIACVVIAALLVYVIIKKIKRKAASPLTPLDDLSTRRTPTSKIQTYGTVHIGNEPIPTNVSSTEQQPPVTDLSGLIAVAQQQQPIRIRTRGLLERRGSSASLTIDLSGDPTSLSYSSPTRECSVEDYLSSAGNRLTRRQLRACLKHSSVLHQEFLGYDDEPMAFIATQGPLPNTVDDFWLMVWQEKVPCIVMMTKLNETNKEGKNKQKCEPYLPAKTGQYGTIGVAIKSTMPRNGYYVRDLEITNGPETRVVKHYWFMGWPDQQAAPTSAARQLLQLSADVQNQRAKCRQHRGLAEAGPIIVHCSAGLGRTGCFIAICIGCRQLQEENMVDVLGVVCQMRVDRGGMIQTPEQYEFIHHALAVYEQQLCESPTTAAMPISAISPTGGHSSSGRGLDIERH